MAQIELDQAWINALSTAMFGLNSAVFGSNATPELAGLLCGTSGGGTPTASAMINIMKGVVPTDLSGLTTYGSRSSDILVSITTPFGSAEPESIQHFSMVIAGQNPVLINSTFKDASASGVATWFRWMVVTRPTISSAPDTMLHQIIGTVGAEGSGADLEMVNTNVVAGNPYRISSLRIQFPTLFTY